MTDIDYHAEIAYLGLSNYLRVEVPQYPDVFVLVNAIRDPREPEMPPGVGPIAFRVRVEYNHDASGPSEAIFFHPSGAARYVEMLLEDYANEYADEETS